MQLNMSAGANNEVERLRPVGTLNEQFLALINHASALPAWRKQERCSLLYLGLAVVLTVLGAAVGVRFPAAWLMLPLGLALCVFGIRSLERARALRLRCERQRSVVKHGEPVTAYVVRASRQLLEPGSEPLPALVLFTFQPEVARDPAYMRYLARRVASMHDTNPPDADGRYVAGLTADEQSVEYRRRMLPLSFTDGSSIYCADLMIRRPYLKGGCLTADSLSCLAERGEAGGIEMIPSWLLDDAPAAYSSSSPSTATGPAVE